MTNQLQLCVPKETTIHIDDGWQRTKVTATGTN